MPAALTLLLVANAVATDLKPATETYHPALVHGIPWSQLGTKAEAGYQGDGLAVTATEHGARLRCAFQQLDGNATDEGLWLTSTVANKTTHPFRVKASAVGRQSAEFHALSARGTLTVTDKLVSFARPGLVEEYTVSMDGLRQDFLITEKPKGAGELQVRLDVTGAHPASAPYGAELALEPSGRKIAYTRLRVTDVNGRELRARIEALLPTSPDAPQRLALLVNDTDALYPLYIDPTFSDANWVSLNPSIPGAGNTVYAAVVDGSGNLYIGGAFTQVGATNANYIAKWDGSSWSPLGSGMNSNVYALATSGATLYAGGDFTTAGGSTAKYIAKWNGTAWSAMDTGVNNTVYAIAVSGGNVYAGGQFTKAGSNLFNDAKYIAKWNATSPTPWSALGSGLNNTVYALATYGTSLYAGGSFTTAGSSQAYYFAQWNGTSWSSPGAFNNTVYALAVMGLTAELYVAGSFTTTSSGSANYIAKTSLIGGGWSALGCGSYGCVDGVNNTVRTLAISGTSLYAGGSFTTAGGNPANYIAQWNGTTWSSLGTSPNNTVYALALSGTNIYAAGAFTSAGFRPVNYVAETSDGSSWSASVPGINSTVYALAVSGTDIYVGGAFTSPATNIAKWDGAGWSALGLGVNNTVYALTVSGTNLYAGGAFSSPGFGVAKWNGTNWSGLGLGMYNGGYSQGNVLALAVSGNNLYAGGAFLIAGGDYVWRIARWNGSAWSTLGLGANNAVRALAISGTDLYVAGYFTAVTNYGGVPLTANYVAKWNGSTWSALGAGANNIVRALAVSGANLYAGGDFTMAGSDLANYVARWDGSSWSAMGSGMNNTVYALAVSTTNVYAGGQFTSPGNNIAKWDGSSWSPLGSGMNSKVFALALSETELFVGGDFTTAGGKFSDYAAKAITTVDPPSITTQPTNQTIAATLNASLSIAVAGTPPFAYQWQKNGTNLAGGGNLSGVLTNTLAFNPAMTNNTGPYRVVVTNAYGSITSTVVTLTVFLPPQNFLARCTNGNRLALQLTGTPTYPYVLQLTTNLVPPVNWQCILTNQTDGNGYWTCTVTNLTSASECFYRAAGQ